MKTQSTVCQITDTSSLQLLVLINTDVGIGVITPLRGGRGEAEYLTSSSLSILVNIRQDGCLIFD